MADVLIHACPDRKWYIEDFLIPELERQGFAIRVSYDMEKKGNLQACLDRFKEVSKEPGDTWHLQDDVYPASDFYKRAEEFPDGEILCGFVHTLFEPFNRPMCGRQPAVFMFNSFPCIRIPNSYAGEFVEWYEEAKTRPNYRDWVQSNKHDDGFFKDFITERHGTEYVWNIVPCLCEHVDYLIGGSITNEWRGYVCRAAYWEEEDRIEELSEKIAHHRAFSKGNAALIRGIYSKEGNRWKL